MTASVPKKHLTFAAALSVCLLILGLAIFYKVVSDHGSTLSVHGKTFKTEIADTQAAQERGLSGRDALASDQAMVFVYSVASRHCFWMKDMKFNIDMVWLDSANKVTAIEQNVSPASYPQDFCHDGKTVVEFAAHVSAATGLKVGDTVRL